MYALNGTAPKATENRDISEVSVFLSTIWRRRIPVLMVFVAFVLATIALTLLSPKRYSTEVKVIAGGSGASGGVNENTIPVLNALMLAAGAQSAETYADLLQQTPIAAQVVRDLHLPISADNLLGHVVVKPVSNTSIISLTADWSDPQTAAAIANDMTRVFVSRERDLIASQATSAIDFLSKQLPVAAARMNKANTALAQYSAAHHIADITTQTQGVIASIATNDSKIGQIKVDREQAQAQLRDLQAQLRGYQPSSNGGSVQATNPVVAQLKTQLAQTNVQLKSARQTYTDENPAVIALLNQQKELNDEISKLPQTITSSVNTVPNPIYQQISNQTAQLQATIAASDAQLAELQRQRASLEPALARLPAETTRLADLQRESKSAQDIYNALQQKYNEASVVQTTAPSDVTVTQPADASRASVKPNFRLNLLIGLAIGLIVAIGSAFFLDFFDNTVKDEADIANRLGLPLLSAIPVITKGENKPEALQRLRNMTIESFIQLVTSLRYSSDRPLRTIAFTSPTPGDGKSTIALNAAIAMAELEPQVLIIDADLRKPTLHTKLNLRDRIGLSDYLVGKSSFDDVVQLTKYPGLHFASSGMRAPNPIKLLRSEKMDDFLAEATRRYACVVLDGPAANAVIDGAVLAAKADGSVLVVSANQTQIPATLRAMNLLQRFGVSNFLGVVLNRATPQHHAYASYYMEGGVQMSLADSVGRS